MEPNLDYRAENQVHHSDFSWHAGYQGCALSAPRSTRTEDTLRKALSIVANGELEELPSVGTTPERSEVAVALSRKKRTGLTTLPVTLCRRRRSQ